MTLLLWVAWAGRSEALHWWSEPLLLHSHWRRTAREAHIGSGDKPGGRTLQSWLHPRVARPTHHYRRPHVGVHRTPHAGPAHRPSHCGRVVGLHHHWRKHPLRGKLLLRLVLLTREGMIWHLVGSGHKRCRALARHIGHVWPGAKRRLRQCVAIRAARHRRRHAICEQNSIYGSGACLQYSRSTAVALYFIEIDMAK